MRMLPAGVLCLLLTACPNPSQIGASSVAPQSQVQNYELPLNLGNGQAVSVSMQIQGQQISGELIVAERALRTQSISHTLRMGRYAFTGSFSPPRGFTMAGNFSEPAEPFSLTGTLPTETDPGSFTFTQGGETVSDILPALNTLPPQPAQQQTSPAPIQPTSPPSPVDPTPVATALPARQWTEPELEAIRSCLSQRVAAYQGTQRGVVIQVIAKVAANVALARNPELPWSDAERQAKRNEAGEFAVAAEAQLQTGCVN
jgi:hypothetical protein